MARIVLNFMVAIMIKRNGRYERNALLTHVIPWLRAGTVPACVSAYCLFPPINHAKAPDFRWVSQIGGATCQGSQNYQHSKNFVTALALDRGGNALFVGRFGALNPSSAYGGCFLIPAL